MPLTEPTTVQDTHRTAILVSGFRNHERISESQDQARREADVAARTHIVGLVIAVPHHTGEPSTNQHRSAYTGVPLRESINRASKLCCATPYTIEMLKLGI